jgi:hypothetical protein
MKTYRPRECACGETFEPRSPNQRSCSTGCALNRNRRLRVERERDPVSGAWRVVREEGRRTEAAAVLIATAQNRLEAEEMIATLRAYLAENPGDAEASALLDGYVRLAAEIDGLARRIRNRHVNPIGRKRYPYLNQTEGRHS